jgi:hypothetical protein
MKAMLEACIENKDQSPGESNFTAMNQEARNEESAMEMIGAAQA